MKAIIYARVSSREQEETGYSLPAQIKSLEGYALQNALEVQKAFSVSESASKVDLRKSFDEMLAYADKHNIKVILCEKADRLTRSIKDSVKINDWLEKDGERQVHLVKENWILSKDSKSHQKFTWNVKVSVAQFYTDNLSEEVKKGFTEKAEQGWFPSRSPLGYKSQGDSGHKVHVIDEATAPLIRKLFEMYATGNYSMKYLTNFAYDQGLRSRKGNKIAKSLIAKLLSDPFYYGMFEYRKKLWPGKHQALISKELFDHVQEMATGKTTPKLTKHPYTFKGLAKCGVCGKTISWERQKGHIYGHCKNYGNCVQRTTIREEKATEEISKAFKELRLDNPRLLEWVKVALKEGNKEKAEYQAASIEQMNQRAEQLRHRLDRLYDDRLDDKIIPEIYERKYQEITTELNSLTVSIKQYDTASEKYHDMGIQLLDIAQQAEIKFVNAQPDKQREIVNLVLENVVIDGNNVSYQYRRPFELLREAVLITNSSKKLVDGTFGETDLRTSKNATVKGNAKILEKILVR